MPRQLLDDGAGQDKDVLGQDGSENVRCLRSFPDGRIGAPAAPPAYLTDHSIKTNC
jgi:hypothetical protein